MISCQFCGEKGTVKDDSFERDINGKGVWCVACDGFTYISKEEVRHRFTLILEDKGASITKVMVPDVRLSKRLSPYRYPGGKTKIIDYLYSHLQQTKSKKLVSPFTGGGSFELAMLEAGLVEQLHLNDFDTGVYSLWWVIKHMPYALVDRIKSNFPTHKDYFKAQRIIELDYQDVDAVDAAWASLLVNRLAYSGIVKANPLGGKNGTKEKLLSRWNPNELIKRIEKVHALSDRIEITQENAVELIEEAYWDDEATIFVDPPYVEKGKKLYHCYYKKEDHIELSVTLDSLYFGCPGADIVVTYDFNKWLDELYEYPERSIIGRVYSI